MRLRISHRTEYRYDMPLSYALQRIRLVPSNGRAQTVLNWKVAVEGASEELRYTDGFGNDTRLLSVEGEPRSVTIAASGEVDTHATSGVSGPPLFSSSAFSEKPPPPGLAQKFPAI